MPTPTRRSFLASTSGLAMSAATHAFASGGSSDIKIALIGCGGRGTGACNQALNAGSTIKLVAVLDPLEGKAQAALDILKQKHEGQVDVPPDQVFTQFEDWQKVYQLADVVLITTPPGPRPFLFEQAIKAGKHVFMEKPVAVDAAGVRRVLAAAEEAKKKNLNVCVGFQRRYDPAYIDMIQRLHAGEIGDLVFGRVYWNGSSRPGFQREPGESEMHYQIRNWYFFTWMSGDHILEQHCHNLDVANWVMQGRMPVRATGQGGRQVRRARENGTIFDHHTVEFEYDNGMRILSQCCQIGGKCQKDVSEHFHGTKGIADLAANGRFLIKGQPPGGRRTRNKSDAYQLEHDTFFENIRTGKVRIDADYAAYSSMMGVMGRMATYTGQVITWDQAFNSTESLVPDNITWKTDPPVKPDADGWYPVAIPGTTMPV
ncbi:MAG: Inositol 2-dehydrogenase/D-chiro-inositol 3-dehydrogenase [Prosthecobacter sp.]|nr:Inositol 2-dehydrogenase/D-chiro-inositol 3-dehydrogenase [Prosthecobacter sp.]